MDRVRLNDGREVVIRPIRPSDGPELNAAYDRLSARSKYLRFLAPKPHLTRADTRYLVSIDGENHFALVACPPDELDHILAVARFVRLPDDPDAAEFAIVVSDHVQGLGLSRMLMQRLAEAATARGISRFRATMLAENRAAHRMARQIPGRLLAERHQGVVDELEIELAA